MIKLYCVNHPHLFWYTKPEAIHNGRYTGARNIFFDLHRECGSAVECSCPASDLRVA